MNNFFISHLHSTPPLVGSPFEYCHKVGIEKLELCGYPMVKSLIVCLPHLEPVLACDRQTSYNSIARDVHMHHAVIICSITENKLEPTTMECI